LLCRVLCRVLRVAQQATEPGCVPGQKAAPAASSPGCSACAREFKRRHHVPVTVHHGAPLCACADDVS